MTSFCGADNGSADDVVDLVSRTDQSTDVQRRACTPADSFDKPPPPLQDESSESASDDDDDDVDDEDARRAADLSLPDEALRHEDARRAAELSLPDEALRHELDLFRTTRAMLIVTVTLWLPLTLANIVYAVSESSRASS